MTGERSITLLLLTTGLMLAGMVAGCHAPAEPTGPTLARVSMETPDRFENLWQAADKTLRRYYLQPDRQDRYEGVIVSKPETSAAWFEIWRPQPTPAYAWLEANISAIRRQATVTMKQVSPTEYDVSVQIDRYRYALEPRQVDNPAGVLRLYGSEAPTQSGRMQKPSEGGEWIPLGRDGAMEAAVLKSILKRFGSGEPVAAPASTTQPADSAQASARKPAG